MLSVPWCILLLIPVTSMGLFFFPRANICMEYFSPFGTRKLVPEVKEERKVPGTDEWRDEGSSSIHLGYDGVEFLSHRKGQWYHHFFCICTVHLASLWAVTTSALANSTPMLTSFANTHFIQQTALKCTLKYLRRQQSKMIHTRIFYQRSWTGENPYLPHI